ncbi:hypothetical protein KKF05_01520 [Patescibacteria group bacterium]|nr:hypothetical protein [Patescibacteria group bacterium]MBU1029237.1 hypothetical protein [Patescibacteria group bacterium]MBU1916121.1 hypothetical protein [Patescibacteria group bacterium]
MSSKLITLVDGVGGKMPEVKLVKGYVVQKVAIGKASGHWKVLGQPVRPPFVRILYTSAGGEEITAQLFPSYSSWEDFTRVVELLKKVDDVRRLCRRIPWFRAMTERMKSAYVAAEVTPISGEDQEPIRAVLSALLNCSPEAILFD